MTDRHTGYLVTLEDPIRDDDDEEILTALLMVKGVISVEPVVDDLFVSAMTTQRVNQQWRRKLLNLVRHDQEEPRVDLTAV